MRVVLDTNVLLSGLAVRGLCETIIDECFDSPDCEIFLSEYILEEFYRHFTGKFKIPKRRAKHVLEFIRDHVDIVEPVEVTHGCSDKDDLPVLGTVLAAKAHCLVTGDKVLLALKEFKGHRILSPRDFYQQLP